MGNMEIMLIVFGFSGIIIIMLIFVFRWLGIRSDNCCFEKKDLYKIDSLNNTKNGKNNYQNSSDFTNIWNSERSLSIMSTTTTDTVLNAVNDSNVNIQLKPNLKPMSNCPSNDEDRLLNIEFIDYNSGLFEVELNYDPYVLYK
jgi:hypothetical protein